MSSKILTVRMDDIWQIPDSEVSALIQKIKSGSLYMDDDQIVDMLSTLKNIVLAQQKSYTDANTHIQVYEDNLSELKGIYKTLEKIGHKQSALETRSNIPRHFILVLVLSIISGVCLFVYVLYRLWRHSSEEDIDQFLNYEERKS